MVTFRCTAGPAAWSTLALGLCLLAEIRPAYAQLAPHDLERARRLIVHLSGDLDGPGTAFGAGIIVGAKNDFLYIATANHVVRSQGRDAANVKASFYFEPGQVDAELMSEVDEELDLRVLRVDLQRQRISTDEIPFDILGDPAVLTVASDVYAIGHPAGERWFVNLQPYAFEKPDGSNLLFQAANIEKGHSGGGMFDGVGQLVGMVKSTGTGRAAATRIDRMVEKLLDWRFPVDLRLTEGDRSAGARPPSGRGGDGQEPMSVSITNVRMVDQADNGLKVSADYSYTGVEERLARLHACARFHDGRQVPGTACGTSLPIGRGSGTLVVDVPFHDPPTARRLLFSRPGEVTFKVEVCIETYQEENFKESQTLMCGEVNVNR